ncbi:ubinuclein-1 [Rhinophrynus dorsalis]
MAEPRRVQLTCLPPTASQNHPSAKKPRIEEQESEPPAAATLRIELTLFEPDQKKCPEFNYPELLRNLQGKVKKSLSGEKAQKKVLNLFDDEAAGRKEVEDLAKKFEEKYGNKKRRRDRMQDMIDMGYGYDESDSFIDNSEAYDELVPASLTTKHGGFYINTGTLQFRQVSESEDESVKEKKKKSPKKIKERGEKVRRKKREEEKKKKQKHSKPGFIALNRAKDKKKKKHTAISEMLARFQREKEAEKNSVLLPPSGPSNKPPAIAPPPPSLPPPPPKEGEPAPDPPNSTLVPSAEVMKSASAADSITEREKVINKPPDKKDGVQAAKGTVECKKPVSIPEGLPSALEKRIKELTKAVRASEGEKKTILFTQEMNTALLDIYLLSRDLTSTQSCAVFTHLSSVLPCSKETLVKWASRLYLHKQGGRLREPLRKLKEAVMRAMPEQINKYNEECKVHNQAKYTKILEDDKEKDQKAASEDEEEDEKGGRKAAGPRKKFQWNEEIRQLLCQLVRIKVDMFEPDGGGSPSLEDYLKSFLDVEVKSVWPRGWMQGRALFKESRRLYPQLSPLTAKNRLVIAQKAKVKDSSNKLDKKAGPSSSEAQGSVVAASNPVKDTPVPSSTASPSPSGTSLLPNNNQDNSLDGDLIHNPPSLDTVSEHLSAISNRSSGQSFDFPSPKTGSSEKTTVVEDKRKSCPPPLSTPSSGQQSQRVGSVDQSGVMGSEKKVGGSSHSTKPSPEGNQGKQKPPPHGPVKHAQVTSPSLQPSVKLYQMSTPQSKGMFMHPINSGAPRVPIPSPPQTKPPPQRPITPQTKPSKPQVSHPTSSTPSNVHRPIISPGILGKHLGNSSTTGPQVYRPPVPRHPVTPNSSSGSPAGQNSSPTPSLNPSPANLQRNSPTIPAKKPAQPLQKLTLVAPQDAKGGTQGVAKLLTSSLVAGVGGSSASPPNISSLKCSMGSPLLTSSPSLTVLTPSYKPNGGKVPGPSPLGLLSPIHSFPLHVLSFTSDQTPKSGASKDAIVTGPAPGTFQHGLPRNLLGSLHANTVNHSTPLPHPALSTHTPTQTDGTHIHGKGPVPPARKL